MPDAIRMQRHDMQPTASTQNPAEASQECLRSCYIFMGYFFGIGVVLKSLINTESLFVEDVLLCPYSVTHFPVEYYMS